MDIKLIMFALLKLMKYSSSVKLKDGILELNHDQGYDIAEYTIIHPKLQHGSDNITIEDTLGENGLHINNLTLIYQYTNKDIILDLNLNTNVIPDGHFLRYQTINGENIVKNFTKTEINFCHYHGTVRENSHSRVALSTCNGINGIIIYNNYTFLIKPGPYYKMNCEHFLYRHTDLIAFNYSEQIINSKLRVKRGTMPVNSVSGPFNSNKNSSYIEFVIVIDNGFYKSKQKNLTEVHFYTIELVNILNFLYARLNNIFIALMGIVVWTTKNEIKISSDSSTTLNNFMKYRKTKLLVDHPNDNAQLLTNEKFDGGVVGRAHKHYMCTTDRSGGITTKHSEFVIKVANTIAHELGHNLGMEHDNESCDCLETNCIMKAKVSAIPPTHFSKCSTYNLSLSFKRGMNHCLKNIPKKLFQIRSSCGNGFVESGEECDCGLKEDCSNICCNPQTCILNRNASCATGECCDLTTCQIRNLGYLCREAEGECDLPELCTGKSEYCPNNVFKRDTEPCNYGRAYCFRGLCQSHSDQCKLLWGVSAKSLKQYYFRNRRGTAMGNCGYNKLTLEYTACAEENIYCGSLHCESLETVLQYGNEHAAIIKETNFKVNGTVIRWKTANIDLGMDSSDPGLAPDGANCGNNKMCLNQKCLSIEQLRREGIGVCLKNCNGNEICDSEGYCRCSGNLVPPACTTFDNSFSVLLVICIAATTLIILVVTLCMYYWYKSLRHSELFRKT